MKCIENPSNPLHDVGGGLSFCPVLRELVCDQESKDDRGRIVPATGLSTVNNLVVLQRMMTEFKPERTLEIGLAYGASTLLMASVHQQLHRQPERQHTAIDPFQKTNYANAGLHALERAGLSVYVQHEDVFSWQALPKQLEVGHLYGLIYIDGSHLFEDVFVDLYYASKLLTNGGLIVFDDCADLHVRKVVRFISANLRGIYEEVNVGQWRLDGGKSLKYKLAHLLERNQLCAFRRIGALPRRWNSPFVRF